MEQRPTFQGEASVSGWVYYCFGGCTVFQMVLAFGPSAFYSVVDAILLLNKPWWANNPCADRSVEGFQGRFV